MFSIKLQFKEREKDRKNNEENILTAFGIIYVLAIRYIRLFLIWLTQYFPFSLLSYLTWINYQNREVFQARCAISDTGLLTGILFKVNEFYKDNYFLYYEGKFKKSIKPDSINKFVKYLGKIYGEGNIYVRNIDENKYLININREVALNRKYYNFISEV